MAHPYYNNFSFLLPMIGVDNGTAFVDLSPNPKPFTKVGDAKTVTSRSKFYNSCAYFDGVGDYLTTPAHADLAIGAGNFTMGMWTFQTENFYLGFGKWVTPYEWCLYIGSNGKPICYLYSGTNYGTPGTDSVPLNQWNYLESDREDNKLYLFVNGNKVSTTTLPTNLTIGSACPSFDVGRFPVSTWHKGFMQDAFLLKGIAMHTENFTPPGRLVTGCSGIIRDINGNPCSREVRIYNRATGALLRTGTSDPVTGDYDLLGHPGAAELSRVILANETGLYNDLIDRVIPY